MKARTWVERTVIDNERGTNNGNGAPLLGFKQGGPLSYHSRSASTTFVAIIQASADSCTRADHATTRKARARGDGRRRARPWARLRAYMRVYAYAHAHVHVHVHVHVHACVYTCVCCGSHERRPHHARRSGFGVGVRGCVGVGLAWRRVLRASVGGELGEWLDEAW